jgi:hypothetical protein
VTVVGVFVTFSKPSAWVYALAEGSDESSVKHDTRDRDKTNLSVIFG